MTDQPNAGRPSQADADVTPSDAWVQPVGAIPAGLEPTPAVPPTAPAQPITAAPGPGSDWGSAPPPAGWSTQGGVAYGTAPVQPVAVARAPRRGIRWLVAAVVVVLVAVSASAAFYLIAGNGSSSTVAKWAPADSIMYMEARFDLPGDQHDKVGQFLSAFPGFADPSTLDDKLGELLDKAIKSASDDKADFTTDIKPWFGGEMGVSVSALPTIPTFASDGTTTSSESLGREAILLSVTDSAKASAWLAKTAQGGTAATYNGVDLLTFGTGSGTSAVGVDGSVLIAGDLASVHAIIDAKGSGGLAASADYQKAVAAMPKDRVGSLFMETAAYFKAEMATMPEAASTLPKELLDKMPAWIGMSARFESSALVIDEVMPAVAGVASSPDRASTLAGHLPASTVATYEVHDLGKGIQDAVTSYEAIPALKDSVTKALAALDQVGGLDSFVGWIGDADVAVTLDGTTIGGGLVVSLADAKASEAAAAKFAALKNLVSLSGLPSAKVTTEDHAGATITTIDLGSVKDLVGASGGDTTSIAGTPEVADARVALSYTVTDTLAIVGIGGDGFVKAVLDTKAGSSLADQPRYTAAFAAAGASNAGSMYIDLKAIVSAVEARLPADSRAAYERDVKPYLAPLSAIAVSSQGGDLMHGRIVLTVTK